MKFLPTKKKETIWYNMENQDIFIGSFSNDFITINSDSAIPTYINTNIVYTLNGYLTTYIGTENNLQDNEI